MRDFVSHLVDAFDVFGAQAFFPVIEIGAAIDLNRVPCLTSEFGRVVGTAGVQNGVFNFWRKGIAQFFIQVTKAIDRVT